MDEKEYTLENQIEPMTNELKEKLKAIGFTEQEFEPKVRNRFIVMMDGVPSHLIKAVRLPDKRVYLGEDAPKVTWSDLDLTLYNPVSENLEKRMLELDVEKLYEITVKVLGPVGDVLTTWKIQGRLESVNFDRLDWSDKGEPTYVYLSFGVNAVEIE